MLPIEEGLRRPRPLGLKAFITNWVFAARPIQEVLRRLLRDPIEGDPKEENQLFRQEHVRDVHQHRARRRHAMHLQTNIN